MSDAIKEYWEERATRSRGELTATTDDVYMRELEIATIVATLRKIGVAPGQSAIDVGCGDGYSTAKVAEALPELQIVGLDFSQQMISVARERLAARPDLRGRLRFELGDVTDLNAACGLTQHAIILTDRCLINLKSFEQQCQALTEIADHLKPGGHYVAVENFVEGHENMNAARRSVGLPEIPIRWHNLYFKEEEFRGAVEKLFDQLTLKDFASSYYLATRIVYSKMCQMRGELPDYGHEIHQLAVNLPWVGQFSPIRMAVMRKKPSTRG